MSLSRRQALGLLVGGGAAVAAGGCRPIAGLFEGRKPSVGRPRTEDEHRVALLNRFGFGARPGQAAEIKGSEKEWFENQLNALEDDDLGIQLKLRKLDIFQYSAYDLRDIPQEEIIRQLQVAAIIRASDSPWQLRERMVDFWTNHFNIFARKGLAAYRKPQDEKHVIRANALGSFHEMLRASAKSTAMLLYLDQQASSFVQPNENYARELLELHTLGVDGGYSQKDVMEAARCFTGWSEEREFLKAKGTFKFLTANHDKGSKVVLGHFIPAGGGVEDGEKVVEIVATHPSTAKHVAKKLCRFFLGSDEGSSVDKVAKVYLDTRGDIKSMLRAIFEEYSAGNYKPTLKRPFDFTVSAIRALDAETEGGQDLQKHLAAMGQPLYQWPMPDGYPDDTASWTGSLLARWNLATALGEGKVPGVELKLKDLTKRHEGASPVSIVFGLPDTHEIVQSLVSRMPSGLDDGVKYALALASPEFQWR